MIPPGPRLRHVRPGFIAAMLLAWFFGQAVTVSPDLGMTADEMIHLTAGYSYWKFDDYRLQPENGNLPQRLAALPLLAMHPAWPPSDDSAWRQTDAWGVGHRMFFHLGNQPELLLFAGRLMVALLGVAAGTLVYLSARDLFGAGGGLIATALFAVNPSLLAHGGLATSDMAAAFGFLACTLSGWRLLHRVTPGRILVFGLSLGTLALAKFSAPLMGFVFAVLVAVRLVRGAFLPMQIGAWRWRGRGWPRIGAIITATALSAVLAYAMIWAAYGFRYSATPAGGETKLLVSWDVLLGHLPYYMGIPSPTGVSRTDLVPVRRNFVRMAAEWAKDQRVLPEAYLYGFLHVYTYSRWRPAFFLGDYKVIGWPAFFPTAFLVKNPLPLLAMYGLMLAVTARLGAYTRRSRRIWYRLTPLLALIGVYSAFALTSRLNIGYRHLLPLELALCVFAGVLVLAARDRLRSLALAGLIAGTGLAGWLARPGYLSYFNSLAGGPNQAYQLFVDSSLDWGQGLPHLQAWLQRNKVTAPAYLTYFGSDSPSYQGLRVMRTGDLFFDREPRRVVVDLTPGIYVVSATLLQGVYTLTPGPWTADYERAYRRLWQQAHAPDSPSRPPDFWNEWDMVRFGRLRHFLRHRTPDAQPDPSLLVYRLSQADLADALNPR